MQLMTRACSSSTVAVGRTFTGNRAREYAVLRSLTEEQPFGRVHQDLMPIRRARSPLGEQVEQLSAVALSVGESRPI
ncbi:MAG: hypothetical protein JWO98_2598 [Frankiales bacterium]|nr:hypothetical protein [Frankiales bacterium]